jgi:homoserine O-succinyltransferase
VRLLVDRGESLSCWTEDGYVRASETIETNDPHMDSLEIAIVNNMPDSAVEDTESQFCRLLAGASGKTPVYVRLYTLPHVPRGKRLQSYLSNNYGGFDDLFNRHLDGVIITGTEPRHSDLKREPYWSEMVALLNWSEENTTSTILSCLAAHASVLNSDGIVRTPLPDKQFGVFEFQKLCKHPLTRGTVDPVRFPHSRWNGIREDALQSAGYSILTRSSESGVDAFVKDKKQSLFVHFQGHPEYGSQTLFNEYRRDVKRYLRAERDNYPSLPRGYFDEAVTRLLSDFRVKAVAERQEATMEFFPDETARGVLQNGWQESANQIYRNWLEYLLCRKTDRSKKPVTVRSGQW